MRIELAQMRQAVRAAHADVRENILSLRTTLASEKGLVSAISEYLDEFGIQTGIETQFTNEAQRELDISSVAEIQLVCILQEALANVRKHAHARCVKVAFTALDKKIQIAIRDDGKGFEPSMLQEDQSSGFGLRFMRERADAIGSSLKVHSAPGEGTEILLTVPMKECDA